MAGPIRTAVSGATGHMGRALMAALEGDPHFALVGGFSRRGGEGLIDRADAISGSDVIIDFSTGRAAADLAADCAAAGGPALVIGATGFEGDDLARIGEASNHIPIVLSGNFSIGLNMLIGLVAQASRLLPAEDWDIEILEAHHRRKIDAPSGTALMLGEAAAEGRGTSLAAVERRGRDGMTGERPEGEIGFAVMRGGGIVGEHSVVFATAEEVVTIAHSAIDRTMFAKGALTAARWLVERKPGQYDMQDVLGLNTRASI